MRTLIFRVGAWIACVALIVMGGSWVGRVLHDRRYPNQAWAEHLLVARLDPTTPEQKRLVKAALRRDPMVSVVAAHEEGWHGLQQFVEGGPNPVMTIQRMALDAGLRQQLDRDAAAGFVDGAFTQYALAARANGAEAEKLLEELQHLAPEEYRNVAADSSYLLIVPGIDSQFRGTFRQHQDLLTPVIAVAEPAEWNDLLQRFDQAMPRVVKIFRDTQTYGAAAVVYGQAYMLHSDLVEVLKGTGIPERDAIDFVGANAGAMRELIHALRNAFRRLREKAHLGKEVTMDRIRDGAYTAAIQGTESDKQAKIIAGHRFGGETDAYVKRLPQMVSEACAAIEQAYFG